MDEGSVRSAFGPGNQVRVFAAQLFRSAPHLFAQGFAQGLHHSRQGVQTPPAIAEGADARQDQAVGPANRLGIRGHHDGQAAPVCGALQCLAAERRLPDP